MYTSLNVKAQVVQIKKGKNETSQHQEVGGTSTFSLKRLMMPMKKPPLLLSEARSACTHAKHNSNQPTFMIRAQTMQSLCLPLPCLSPLAGVSQALFRGTTHTEERKVADL